MTTTVSEFDLLAFIADDRHMVPYRPRWNQITGGVAATILLQQIVYRWVRAGRQTFYKFARPCGHRLYRAGDSWEEEIGMRRREFENARDGLATRTRGELDPHSLVSCWVDAQRVTWYAVNEERLLDALLGLGPAPEWLPVTTHRYRPPFRSLATRVQFNRRRAEHYRALVGRDGERCRHCGATQNLTIDHIHAIVNGGGNDLDNLQLLCRSCNSRKGAR